MKDIEQKWTAVDDLIMNMMQTYPLLYPSRIECWFHLFAGDGGGYKWNMETGLLYYDGPAQSQIVPDDGPHLETILHTDDKLIRCIRKRTNILRQYTWDNMKMFVKDYHYSTAKRDITSIHSLNWSEPNSEYFRPELMQQACMNKEKISTDWRYEISYFCDWVIRQVRRFCYSPSRQDKPRLTKEEVASLLEKTGIRKLSDMRYAFLAVIKVKDNIFTSEEKKKHEKRHKEMMEMIEKITKD